LSRFAAIVVAVLASAAPVRAQTAEPTQRLAAIDPTVSASATDAPPCSRPNG
jgi:hypothetical protein